MERFRNILFVMTEEQNNRTALERAVSLAESNQAELTVISVMPPVSIGMGMPESGPISAELQKKALDVRTTELQSTVGTFQDRLNFGSKVLIGVQFLEVIRQVLRNRHDLVIKMPESGDWLDHLLASEDMHLLRKCPCPVWLIKPGPDGSFRRVLAAIDVVDIYPEPERKTRQLLNNQIIQMATSVALTDSSELHIVHAWQAMGEHLLREMSMQMKGFDIDAYVAGVKKERQDSMNRLLQSVTCDLGADVLNYLKPQMHLVKGRARKQIPALAFELKADLVVIGTVARTGIPGLFTGNTAESILSQINCSVLAIKPAGFQTPVTLA